VNRHVAVLAVLEFQASLVDVMAEVPAGLVAPVEVPAAA